MLLDDPARIDTRLDFEIHQLRKPTGARGSGASAGNGRKGSPARLVMPGERQTVARIKGWGRLRHIWMTFPPADPATTRPMLLEVFYEGMEEPSISVPCLVFFGMPHGLGNWLTREQAKELLAVPDRSTLKGKRDYVILSLLVGCALRRGELASLSIEDIQMREGRWVIAISAESAIASGP